VRPKLMAAAPIGKSAAQTISDEVRPSMPQ
jgi:hypothetical protein